MTPTEIRTFRLVEYSFQSSLHLPTLFQNSNHTSHFIFSFLFLDLLQENELGKLSLGSLQDPPPGQFSGEGRTPSGELLRLPLAILCDSTSPNFYLTTCSARCFA